MFMLPCMCWLNISNGKNPSSSQHTHCWMSQTAWFLKQIQMGFLTLEPGQDRLSKNWGFLVEWGTTSLLDVVSSTYSDTTIEVTTREWLQPTQEWACLVHSQHALGSQPTLTLLVQFTSVCVPWETVSKWILNSSLIFIFRNCFNLRAARFRKAAS